jgi:hypothetical protein
MRKVMCEEARTEEMKMMRFSSDFLMSGRKARETRRGATVLKVISSANSSRSLKEEGQQLEGRQKNQILYLQFLERRGWVWILSCVVHKVIKSVWEERGGSIDGLVDALLAGNIELDKLKAVRVFPGQSLQLGARDTARSRNDKVLLVLEL